MEEIINRHKATLETKGAKESEILELLNLLKTMPMTADLLSKTKIGVAVQQVRTASESSAAVKELARDVIVQWIAIARPGQKRPAEGAPASKTDCAAKDGLGQKSPAEEEPASKVQKTDSGAKKGLQYLEIEEKLRDRSYPRAQTFFSRKRQLKEHVCHSRCQVPARR